MATTIYKYIKQEHLELFFRFGRLKIGTLFDYRREEEYGSIIGDREEGQLKSVFENPPSAFKLGDGSPEADYFKKFLSFEGAGKISLKKGARIITPINSPNYYIFCASSKFDPEIMTNYGGACIEISDVESFLNEVNQIMRIKHRAIFQGIHSILYCNREVDYKTTQSNHPALMKDERWKKDNEVRAIWKTEDGQIREQFLYISVTRAIKFCRIHS